MLRCVDDFLSIGEFSERSGLSPKRLRSYAAGGLLLPAAVDPTSGYRYYSPGQLREAHLIDALRDAGMPLVDRRASSRPLGRARSDPRLSAKMSGDDGTRTHDFLLAKQDRRRRPLTPDL
jgi:DNA-binding transcriptional MerR regulator